MKKKVIFHLSSMMLILMSVMIFSPALVKAGEVLVWEGEVYSKGVTVFSPTLEAGVIYRIVASEIFFYDFPNQLAADPQWYTDQDGVNWWNWLNNIICPVPHSFLQINDADINWGPFSNGDTGHMYSIYYMGEGAPIGFKIVDWVDLNYGNNFSHFPLKIYRVTSVGGIIVRSNILKVIPLLAVCAFIAALLTTRRILKSR